MWQPGPVCTSCLQTRPSPASAHFLHRSKKQQQQQRRRKKKQQQNTQTIFSFLPTAALNPLHLWPPPSCLPALHSSFFLGSALCRHAPIFFFSFLSLFTRISLSVRIIRNFFLRPVFFPSSSSDTGSNVIADFLHLRPATRGEPVLCTELHPLQSDLHSTLRTRFSNIRENALGEGGNTRVMVFFDFLIFEKDTILQIFFLDNAIIWL